MSEDLDIAPPNPNAYKALDFLTDFQQEVSDRFTFAKADKTDRAIQGVKVDMDLSSSSSSSSRAPPLETPLLSPYYFVSKLAVSKIVESLLQVLTKLPFTDHRFSSSKLRISGLTFVNHEALEFMISLWEKDSEATYIEIQRRSGDSLYFASFFSNLLSSLNQHNSEIISECDFPVDSKQQTPFWERSLDFPSQNELTTSQATEMMTMIENEYHDVRRHMMASLAREIERSSDVSQVAQVSDFAQRLIKVVSSSRDVQMVFNGASIISNMLKKSASFQKQTVEMNLAQVTQAIEKRWTDSIRIPSMTIAHQMQHCRSLLA